MIRIGTVNIDNSHAPSFAEILLNGNRARYSRDAFHLLEILYGIVDVGSFRNLYGDCRDDAIVVQNLSFILSNCRKEWLLAYLCIIRDDEVRHGDELGVVRHVDGLDDGDLAGAARDGCQEADNDGNNLHSILRCKSSAGSQCQKRADARPE